MSETYELFMMAAIWMLISGGIAYFIKGWSARISFLVFAIGLPFWELPYGYYNFHRLCREEGALKIFESIVPQESVCVDYPFDTSALAMMKRGFKTVESRDKKGGIVRYSKGSSGEVEKIQSDKLSSEYCVTYAFVRGLPWRVMRNEHLIVRHSDKKIVARHSDFVWLGMWWQESLLPVFGRGGECRHDGIGVIAHTLLRSVK